MSVEDEKREQRVRQLAKQMQSILPIHCNPLAEIIDSAILQVLADHGLESKDVVAKLQLATQGSPPPATENLDEAYSLAVAEISREISHAGCWAHDFVMKVVKKHLEPLVLIAGSAGCEREMLLKSLQKQLKTAMDYRTLVGRSRQHGFLTTFEQLTASSIEVIREMFSLKARVLGEVLAAKSALTAVTGANVAEAIDRIREVEELLTEERANE